MVSLSCADSPLVPPACLFACQMVASVAVATVVEAVATVVAAAAMVAVVSGGRAWVGSHCGKPAVKQFAVPLHDCSAVCLLSSDAVMPNDCQLLLGL